MKSMLSRAADVAIGGTPERNFRLGCVAVRKDGAIVSSRNERTLVPNPCAHAEFRVLKKAGYGAKLWVARVDKQGEWTMARPCKRCQALIQSRGVTKVYYTISPGEWGTWYPNKEPIKQLKKEKNKKGKVTWVES